MLGIGKLAAGAEDYYLGIVVAVGNSGRASASTTNLRLVRQLRCQAKYGVGRGVGLWSRHWRRPRWFVRSGLERCELPCQHSTETV